MWPLFRAEIQYNSPIFWYIVVCSVLGFLGIHFMPEITGEAPLNPNSGTIFLSLMVAYFMMSMLSNPWGKEKRTRQLLKLPVSLQQIKIAHFLVYILYWILLVFLYLLCTLVSEYFVLDASAFLMLCVQTGIAFFIFALFGFVSCFPDSAGRKSIEIFLLLLFLFISIAGIIHTYQAKGDTHFVDSVLSWMYQSKLSASLWLIFGLGLTVLVLRFAIRKSYADS
ncbi:MAG: hypothetical protein PVH84_12365 [Candidatus Aminicenantes bacterium]|jgi:hypothetical protein